MSQIKQFSMQTLQETLQNYCSYSTALLDHLPAQLDTPSAAGLGTCYSIHTCSCATFGLGGSLSYSRIQMFLLSHHRDVIMWTRWHHTTEWMMMPISSLHLLTTLLVVGTPGLSQDEKKISKESCQGLLGTFFLFFTSINE